MRRRGDRRLTDIIVAIERRKAARRDLEIQRRAIEDRRKLEMKVEEERRLAVRRAEDIEKLKKKLQNSTSYVAANGIRSFTPSTIFKVSTPSGR